MASTKNLLIFGLLLAIVLISFQVGASSTQKNKASGDVQEAQLGGGGYPGNGRGGGYPGRGGGGGGRNGYPWRGCRYGCCRGFRYGNGCAKCCFTAHQTPDAVFEDDINN
ncbi:glycine-rich protein 3 short isoform-like isoform X2 [Solanum stenotomum]|uniref:glycine-rich protein 3 short isoform-like isoform X2 n=1 Tax=Solanum stenotomum TaxID=172797 RepID=UPI0020D08E96|nr:glycine-rich protein 3 short isoform-like isoform X2 [Solanum stenotomum]